MTLARGIKSKRITPTRARYASGLFDELVVDSFAGGGGASIGIERALGRAVDVAINHDRQAVAMHQVNHPHTLHHCESVWQVDPVKVAGGRPVGLLWASPDCTDFSRAKGGQPIRKQIRGLAWVVIRWAKRVQPRVIMLENVREFSDWGPLIPKLDKVSGLPVANADGSPQMVRCPDRKGLTFRKWTGQLRGLGYTVEHRTLDAADYGAPTHRKRLFLIARRDGQPIVWPDATHGKGRLPYRTAAECIDWSLPCPSIFLSREEGRAAHCNRPLRPNTMRRIAMGIKRFVIENPNPFIVQVNHGGKDFRGQAVRKPLPTVTGKHGYGLVAPFLTAQFGEAPGQVPRAHAIDKPIPVVTPRNGGGFPLILPHLVQYNTEKGDETRGCRADGPVNTITADPRFALSAATIVKHYGGVVGHGPGRPIGTITSIDHHSVAAANLVRIGQTGGNGAYVNATGDPLTTVTSKAEHCLAVSHLSKFYGTNIGVDPRDPLPTVVGQGQHFAEVRAFLTKYYGTGGSGQPCDEPLHTITGNDRFGLVTVKGQDYVIADIGLRMLKPRELYSCQGFPPDYIIDRDAKGAPFPIYVQVEKCGNSVSPPVAEALVRANVCVLEAIAS